MIDNKLLIKNAQIVDGSGKDAFNGDILIIGDTIERIGKSADMQTIGVTELDVHGRTVTPGFIDIHRHCDYALFKPGFGQIELAQGITTTITGSCGLTPFPLNPVYEKGLQNLLAPCLGEKPDLIDYTDYDSYYAALENTPLPINVGGQIGSCSVRIAVKGFESTPFTKDELWRAEKYVDDALNAGAFGVSMGLMYTPEFFSTMDDLTKIAKLIAKHDAVLTCHIRGEGDGLCKSVAEVIDIAKQTGVRLEISHFKACGSHNWQRSVYEAIDMIDGARSAGLNVGVDFYPYTGGATTLLSLIPPYYMKDSLEATLEFMSSASGVKALRESLSIEHKSWDNYINSLGWDRLILTSAENEENLICSGKSIAQITELKGYRDEYDCLCDLIVSEHGRAGVIVMSMDPVDVDTIARLPYSSVISDSLYVRGSGAHPRLYGAFSKVLHDMVNNRKILTLENAVNKMTFKPAQMAGISGRGLVKEGFKADICIFDLGNIMDHSTYQAPKRLSSGMDYVLVNGRVMWSGSKIALANAGQRLRACSASRL